MNSIKLKIGFEDRLGLVLDITSVLLNYRLNIVTLQLMNGNIYLELTNYKTESWPALKSELENIAAIRSLDIIDDMPYEAREKQIDAIMNSLQPLQKKEKGFADIIGQSERIKKVIALAYHVADTDSIIMLRGESGTGKELFARAIHMSSSRKDKVFVPINCGAIPENLLESELFGYVDGAFSGARKGGRVGLFQFAQDGTLFLDEISELPLQLQVKLLRVLQEGRVRPLGVNEEVLINCRIITATNRNIEEMVEKGLFREDLYYRLNVIPIFIPPLRQRKDDIPLIVEKYFQKHFLRVGAKKKLTPLAQQKLLNYSWPGNVRELENVLERALHIANGTDILENDIIFDVSSEYFEISPSLETEAADIKNAVASTEKEIIMAALKKHGSIRKTARALGVSHTTIANKIKKLGLCKE